MKDIIQLWKEYRDDISRREKEYYTWVELRGLSLMELMPFNEKSSFEGFMDFCVKKMASE